MSGIRYSRLISGPDAGKLQIVIDVRLGAADEIAIARTAGCEERVREELAKPVRRRAITGVAQPAGEAMWNALVALADKGYGMIQKEKAKTPRRKRRGK